MSTVCLWFKQGEVSFLVCGRRYLTPFSFPRKYNWVCRLLIASQKVWCFEIKEKAPVTSSSTLDQPEEAREAAPFQCLLWHGDHQSALLLEFPVTLTSLVSICSWWSLIPYLIRICTLTGVRQSIGRKCPWRNLRLSSSWCLLICSFQKIADCPFHRLTAYYYLLRTNAILSPGWSTLTCNRWHRCS